MSSAILTEESTLTERYQSTIPAAVRKVLKLRKGEKIRYIISDDGRVELTRADIAEADDPALKNFLQFLASDINNNPEQLKFFSSPLQKQMKELVSGIKVDLDAALKPEDE